MFLVVGALNEIVRFSKSIHISIYVWEISNKRNYRNDSRTKHKREEKTTNFFKSEKKAENQINEPL